MPIASPPDSGALGRRLDGWKLIASYADRSERAVQRWAAERRFPVHRVGGGSTGSVYAWTGEIDAWFARQAAESLAEPESSASEPPEPRGLAAGDETTTGAVDSTGHSSQETRTWRALSVAAALGMFVGMTLMWGLLRPRAVHVLPPGALEPCHAVAWPTKDLPATGGRWRLAVRTLSAPCDHWVAPTTESRWLLVTPPATASTPPPTTLSAINPLAMPEYEPAATTLSLEVVANHTASPREAVLQFGSSQVRIRQAAAREACTATPGTGYIAAGWRYRMTAARYRPSMDLINRVREDVGRTAEPVSWQMLLDLFDGNPDRGMAFAEAVGLPRHSWEERNDAGGCFNVHLTDSIPPMFIGYHLGRKPQSYTAYAEINIHQYDLGRWDHPGQALYRERVP